MLTQREADTLMRRSREGGWSHEEYCEVYQAAARWSRGSKARAELVHHGLPARVMFEQQKAQAAAQAQ